ncbi:MAG: flagellar export chaperone FlgN [Bacillota bacterium]|nr:flagellar export chaperone FlgN [Bacillota bacterium]
MTALCAAMEEEREACRRLYAGGRKVQAALAEGRTDGVQAALRRQDAALQQLERARRRRRVAQEGVAGALGMAPATPFATLLQRLPPGEAERLGALKQALEDEVERVSRVNETTMRLIEAFGRYVDFLRDLVQRHETVSAYAPDGRPAAPKKISAARSLSRYR